MNFGGALIVGGTVGAGRGVAVAVGNGVGTGMEVDMGDKGCDVEQAATATQANTSIKEGPSVRNMRAFSFCVRYRSNAFFILISASSNVARGQPKFKRTKPCPPVP